MNIRILGCSGGACGELRTTALQVGDSILVDCGTGVGDLTLAEMARIRDVFLTHSHLDHVLFLPLLADAALALRDGPLTVHALPETIAALRVHVFNDLLWPDYTRLPTPERAYVRLLPLQLGESRAVSGGSITALPARHTVPAVGYLIDSGAASFAFSGDTTFCASFWDTLNRVENLKYVMMETTMRDSDGAIAERSCHTTPSLLMRGVTRLTRAAQILVTHIEPDKVAEVRAEIAALAKKFKPHFVMRNETYAL